MCERAILNITYVGSLMNYESISIIVALITSKEAAGVLLLGLMNFLMVVKVILALVVLSALLALEILAECLLRIFMSVPPPRGKMDKLKR